MIPNHKQVCRELASVIAVLGNDAFHYGGYWDKHYHFQRGDYKQGFTLMSCLEEDLTVKNLQFMADKGLTRIVGFKY